MNSYLYNASGHIESINGKPTSTTLNAVKKAKVETDKIVEQINDFVKTEWKKHQEEIPTYQTKMFEDYNELKRE